MPWRRLRRLQLMGEHQATGASREIFQDVRRTLGIPFVPTAFRVYAAYPAFLDLHWRALKPVATTQEFFTLGERLRADAYTRMHNYFQVPDLRAPLQELHFSEGARQELEAAVELYNHTQALVLLMVSAQQAAFEGPVGRAQRATRPAIRPLFDVRPLTIEEEVETPAVHRIFEEIRRTLSQPVLQNSYRALARWPDFLLAYWTALKPMAESPLFAENHARLREAAALLVEEMPGPIELSIAQLQDAGIAGEDISAVARMTSDLVQMESAAVLNLAVAKIGLEGGTLLSKPEEAAAGQHPGRAA